MKLLVISWGKKQKYKTNKKANSFGSILSTHLKDEKGNKIYDR